jgi:HK97 family phage portal protein
MFDNWFKKKETRSIQVDDAFSAYLQDSKSSITNEDQALTISALNCGVRVISETIAGLPWHVFDADTKNKSNDSTYRLCHDAPNHEMTSFVWRQTAIVNLILFGNFFAEIERANDGTPLNLWLIYPRLVEVKRNEQGRLFYLIDNKTIIPSENMIHVAGMSLLGTQGDRLIKNAKEVLSLSVQTDSYSNALFRNSCSVGGWLTHPSNLNDDAKKQVLKMMEARHKGGDNAFKLGLLSGGLDYKPANQMTAKDAQAIEQKYWILTEVARFLNLPPTLLHDLRYSTYSNSYEQRQSFYQLTLLPYLCRIEQEVNKKLFPDRDKYCEFNVDGLLRADPATRSGFYSSMWDRGVISAQEIRRKENLTEVDGLDKHYAPLNFNAVNQPDIPQMLSILQSNLTTEQKKAMLAIASPQLSQEQLDKLAS